MFGIGELVITGWLLISINQRTSCERQACMPLPQRAEDVFVQPVPYATWEACGRVRDAQARQASARESMATAQVQAETPEAYLREERRFVCLPVWGKSGQEPRHE